MAANSFQDSQSLHEPSIIVKMLQSLVYGLGAAIVWGLLFGLLSRITVLMGIIGSVGLGFVTAAMVLMPFKQLGRAHALILFPVSFVLTLVGTGLIILIPFVLVTLAVDSKATLQVAIALAWDFYRLSLHQVGSSLIITVIAVICAVLGYVGRLNRLKKTGVYKT